MAESDQTPGGRPSLVARVLGADERTQLQVIRAAIESSDDLLAALEFAALATGMRRVVPLGAA